MSTQARPGMQIDRDLTCEIRQTDGHTDGWIKAIRCTQAHEDKLAYTHRKKVAVPHARTRSKSHKPTVPVERLRKHMHHDRPHVQSAVANDHIHRFVSVPAKIF
jgi:hypothetical protein